MHTKLRHGVALILGFIAILIAFSIIPSQTASGAVKISTKSLTLPRGGKATLSVSGTRQKVTWYTSKSKVATVKGGVVTAKKAGSTYITAKVGRKRYVCKVTVLSCKVNSSKVIMTKGKTFTLKVTGASKKPTFKSNNTSIVTVNKKTGKITAKRTGTTKIWVTVGSKKFSIPVTIESPKLSKTSITIKRDSLYTLKLATKRSVKWSTSDASVAQVNSKGQVTAVRSGKATIKATLNDKTFTCKVTVKTYTVVNWPSTITVGLGKSVNYSLVAGEGFSMTSKDTYITRKLTPLDYAENERVTFTFTGEVVGSENILLKDSNGLNKVIKVQVVGNVLPAAGNYMTMNNTFINQYSAYKGTGPSPWINVKGTVTYRSTKELDSLYVCYGFYNKSDQLMKSFYYSIDNPEKDKAYSFCHTFDGSDQTWTSEATYTKITYVDGVLPSELANTTASSNLTSSLSNECDDLTISDCFFKANYDSNHAYQYTIHYFFKTQYSGSEAKSYCYYFEFYDRNNKLVGQSKEYYKEQSYEPSQAKAIIGTLSNVRGSMTGGEISSVKLIVRVK